MTQEELLEVMATKEDLPYNWSYCFNDDCQRKDECICYLSRKYLKDNAITARTVLPNAWKNQDCAAFCQIQMVKVAWGFDSLFSEVKMKDASTLRLRMRSYLGSKGQYYRYKLGQRKLSPKQQEGVLQIFHNLGYDDVKFDHYEYEQAFSRYLD